MALSPGLTVATRRLLFALSRTAPREGFRSWAQRAVLRNDLGASDGSGSALGDLVGLDPLHCDMFAVNLYQLGCGCGS